MYVHPDARGRTVASLLLTRIDTDAAAQETRQIVRETGTLHESAPALYRRYGYREILQFGQYVGEEFSVCFGKRL